MSRNPDRKGAAGTVLGCLAALAAAPALGLPFLMFTMLGDCPPEGGCRREDPAYLYGGGALILLLAALLGLSVRALVGWGLERRRGGGAGFPMWAALAGGAVAVLLAWTGWQAWRALAD